MATIELPIDAVRGGGLFLFPSESFSAPTDND